MDGNVSSKLCGVGACGNKAYWIRLIIKKNKKQKDTVLGCMGQWYIAGFDSSFISYYSLSIVQNKWELLIFHGRLEEVFVLIMEPM